MLKAYIVGAVISAYIISGIAFADLEHDFGAEHNRWRISLEEADWPERQCHSNLGFSLGWSVLASSLWPVFLPGIYLFTGFAPDGVWTRYPASYCHGLNERIKR